MVFLLSVDGVLRAGTVIVAAKLLDNVESALTSTVTVGIVAITIGGIALVRSCGVRVLVGLLQVHLRAERVLHVGIAIEPVVVLGVKAATPVTTGHLHGVEGVHAAALEGTDVGVPLDVAAKEVGHVELRVGGVPVRCIHDVSAIVHVADVLFVLRAAPVGDEVLGSINAIDGHGNWGKGSVLLLLLREGRILGCLHGLGTDDGQGSDK